MADECWMENVGPLLTAQTWESILAEFTKSAADYGTVEGAAQEAYMQAMKYCKENCLTDLIPRPQPYSSMAEREQHFVGQATMAHITKDLAQKEAEDV